MIAKYFLIMLSFILLYGCSSSDKINEIKPKDIPRVSTGSVLDILDVSETNSSVIESFTHQIAYTDNGYDPSNITINMGDTVSYINNSTIPMWTASDPHPEHTDYSEFDALKSYNPGETYTLKYNESGSYGFHNHKKSLHRGVIQVIDPKNPQPSVDKTKQENRAQKDLLLSKLDRENPESLFTVIDSIEADPKFAEDCHDIHHDTGHKSYEFFGFSTAMTLATPGSENNTSINDKCRGGYMHGILEELFLHHPELKSNPEKVCSSVADQSQYHCFHGLGHGLMFAHSRSVEASLLSCRKISNIQHSRVCFDGVWMEMFGGNLDHFGDDSLGWDLEKPLESCENAKIDEKPGCYRFASIGYLRTHPGKLEGLIGFCTQEKLSIGDSKLCIRGIGDRTVILQTNNIQSLSLIDTSTLDISPELKESYYSSMIGSSLFLGAKERDLIDFCNTLKNDTKICLQAVDEKPSL